MAVNLSLFAGAGAQFFDNYGVILTGGKIYTYLAGTTTPAATYTSSSGSTAQTNPIILDSAGRVATGEIWLTSGLTYKFILKTSADVLIATYDNITGANDIVYVNDSANISFIQAGTGAVTTTAQTKMREWFSPHDFGAAGNSNDNGTTGTNDSAAFSLLEAQQTSGVVNMNDKFYLVSSPIPTKNNYINGKFVLANGTTYDQPNNTSFGYQALYNNTFVPNVWPAGGGINYASGNYNTAFGDSALRANTTGRRNTAVGTYAMYNNIGGYYNCAYGSLALYTNTSGDYNNSFGNQSLQYNTIGSNNNAFGMGALGLNVDGNDNVAMGYLALQLGTSPDRVVAIGTQAAYRYEGSDTVAIGYQALSNSGAIGAYNVAIGSASMGAMTSGNSNIGIGRRTLNTQTTASNNVAIGTDAMASSGNGDSNVAIGSNALANTTTAFQNVAIGFSAGAGLTTGANNVFIGRYVAQLTTTASGCVAIGEQALASNVGGIQNTCIGQSADSSSATYNNITSLGYSAVVTGSNQVQLGNSSTTTYAFGAVQNRSDSRDKTDVRDTVLGLNFINSLRPVDFKWDMRDDYRSAAPQPPAADATDEERLAHKAALTKWNEDNQLSKLSSNGSKKRGRYHHGLIAQEVKEVMASANVDFGGFQDHSINGGQDVMSIGYEELIAPLIKAVQQLSAEIAELKAKNG